MKTNFQDFLNELNSDTYDGMMSATKYKDDPKSIRRYQTASYLKQMSKYLKYIVKPFTVYIKDLGNINFKIEDIKVFPIEKYAEFKNADGDTLIFSWKTEVYDLQLETENHIRSAYITRRDANMLSLILKQDNVKITPQDVPQS